MNLVENIRSAFSNAKSRNERDWSEYNSILQKAEPEEHDGARLAELAAKLNISPDALEREAAACCRLREIEKRIAVAQATAAETEGKVGKAGDALAAVQRQIAISRHALAGLDAQLIGEQTSAFRDAAILALIIARDDGSTASYWLTAHNWQNVGPFMWSRKDYQQGFAFHVSAALKVELLQRSAPVLSQTLQRVAAECLATIAG